MSAPRIDHVGILVADLERAVERFRALFPDGAAVVREMPEVGIRVAMIEAENLTLEFIEYTSGEPGLARRTMGSRLGINHLSARVEDVSASVERLRAAGFETLEGFPTEGAHGPVAFFAPDETTGLLFEVCQRD